MAKCVTFIKSSSKLQSLRINFLAICKPVGAVHSNVIHGLVSHLLFYLDCFVRKHIGYIEHSERHETQYETTGSLISVHRQRYLLRCLNLKWLASHTKAWIGVSKGDSPC